MGLRGKPGRRALRQSIQRRASHQFAGTRGRKSTAFTVGMPTIQLPSASIWSTPSNTARPTIARIISTSVGYWYQTEPSHRFPRSAAGRRTDCDAEVGISKDGSIVSTRAITSLNLQGDVSMSSDDLQCGPASQVVHLAWAVQLRPLPYKLPGQPDYRLPEYARAQNYVSLKTVELLLVPEAMLTHGQCCQGRLRKFLVSPSRSHHSHLVHHRRQFASLEGNRSAHLLGRA